MEPRRKIQNTPRGICDFHLNYPDGEAKREAIGDSDLAWKRGITFVPILKNFSTDSILIC